MHRDNKPMGLPRRRGAAVLVAAVIGLVGMSAGCSASAPAAGTNYGAGSGGKPLPGKPFAGQTVVVDYFSPPPGKDLLADFTKKTGINVQWNQFQFDALLTKIQTAMAAHVYFADITDFDLTRMGLFKAGKWYAPLEKFIPPAQLIQQVPIAKSFMADGHLMGVPVDGMVAATTMNMSQLKKAGVAQAPTTFDEFDRDLRKVQQSGVSAHPLDIPFAAAEGLSVQWYSYTMAMGGKEILDKNDVPTFTEPSSPGYKAFEWMVQAFKTGLVPPQNINYADIQSQQAEMARGVTMANLADYTDNVDSLYNDPKLSTVKGQIAYIPTPGIDGTAPNDEIPDGMVVPSTAKNIGAAAALIKYLADAKPNAQINGLDGPGSSIPGWAGPPSNVKSLSLLSAAGKLQEAPALARFSADALWVFPHGCPPWYPQFSAAIYQNLRAAAQGQKTVSEAVSAIATTANSLRNSS